MSSDKDDRHGDDGYYHSDGVNDHDDITTDIQSFLDDFSMIKLGTSTGVSHSSSDHRAFEMRHWPPAPNEAAISEHTRSSRSRTYQPSTVFSHHSSRRPSSYASRGTERTEVDRNEIPPQEFGAYYVVYQPTADSAEFACEFDKYTECTATFALGDELRWIEHTASHFDSIGLPMVCLCWYCDEWEFNAETVGGDKWMNFRNRMLHISEHLAENDGRDVCPRRLDAWIVDHLWEKRAISRNVYTRETSRHEMPQIDGLLSAGERSPVQRRREEKNARVLHDNGKEERQLRRQHRKNPNGKRPY